MSTIDKVHWSARVRQENAVLREALDIAMAALIDIPASRLEKGRRFPYSGDPDIDPAMDLAYRTCAEESDRLGQAVKGQVVDLLAEKGVRI